jgi:hypothetical protein
MLRATLFCVVMAAAGITQAAVVRFDGRDAVAGPGDPRPNADAARSAFLSAVGGSPFALTFEGVPIGYAPLLNFTTFTFTQVGTADTIFGGNDTGVTKDRGNWRARISVRGTWESLGSHGICGRGVRQAGAAARQGERTLDWTARATSWLMARWCRKSRTSRVASRSRATGRHNALDCAQGWNSWCVQTHTGGRKALFRRKCGDNRWYGFGVDDLGSAQ